MPERSNNKFSIKAKNQSCRPSRPTWLCAFVLFAEVEYMSRRLNLMIFRSTSVFRIKQAHSFSTNKAVVSTAKSKRVEWIFPSWSDQQFIHSIQIRDPLKGMSKRFSDKNIIIVLPFFLKCLWQLNSTFSWHSNDLFNIHVYSIEYNLWRWTCSSRPNKVQP